MTNWLNSNKNSIIRNVFLLPIILVVIMSISHVVSWYDLGNPYSWAIYLSIAIEIFALASVSAATIKINRAAIWFLFGLVTLIQIIGNIFFEYRDIDISSDGFLSWIELIQPFFDGWDATDHRRFLAIIQGGTLPLMSLTALHYYIMFKDKEEETQHNITDEPTKPESVEDLGYNPDELKEAINIWGQTRGSLDGISDDDIMRNYKDFIANRDKNIIKKATKAKNLDVDPVTGKMSR